MLFTYSSSTRALPSREWEKMQPQCMPQTFYIASRTAHIKGFTVKSSCNQHRIDLHRPLLTASMYFMSSYTPVFKTKEKKLYIGTVFQPVCYVFCILSHVGFTDLRLKNVNEQPGYFDKRKILGIEHHLRSSHQILQQKPCLQITSFFILNLSERCYVIYHIYIIYIYKVYREIVYL